jgi:hypothetical protein
VSGKQVAPIHSAARFDGQRWRDADVLIWFLAELRLLKL